MPYSLVSAATLGFDLVRLPGGPDVATVLLAGLGAGPEHLQQWAAHHPVVSGSTAQRTRWSDRSTRIREVAAGGVVGLRTAQAHPEARTEALVALLEQGTIGDAASLERLLREDVLGPESGAAVAVGTDVRELAADVLADAAVAGWAAAAVSERDRKAVTAVVDLVGPVPEPDLGPAAGALAQLADVAAGFDEVRRGRWRVAVDEVREARRPGRPRCTAPPGPRTSRGAPGPWAPPSWWPCGRSGRPGSPPATVPAGSGTPSPASCRGWPWPTSSTARRSTSCCSRGCSRRGPTRRGCTPPPA